MYPQDAYVGNTCDTFVSYTIHLGYILGYTPDSGYIYNTSAIHVSYVLWCIATCIVRITNLTLGSSVSQMYLCAIHVSCMYCDVSSAIRRDTSRYVVLREKVPKSEGKGPPTLRGAAELSFSTVFRVSVCVSMQRPRGEGSPSPSICMHASCPPLSGCG